jgi:hypothetical protein
MNTVKVTESSAVLEMNRKELTAIILSLETMLVDRRSSLQKRRFLQKLQKNLAIVKNQVIRD